MKKFKHSGAMGDLIYSLPIVKHFGGGEFYLHLNQMNWIGQHYYGSLPAPFHRDRLNQQDFEFMREFIEAQPYINKFSVLDPKVEITHNLDRFRPAFVGHPGNYVDIYSNTFNIRSPDIQKTIRETPWLSVPEPRDLKGRTTVINRTERWLPPSLSPSWAQWQADGAEDNSVFVGLPQEYHLFKKATGWDIPYVPTNNLLELASVIAGAQRFIGNQSQCLALAIGLGLEFFCENRQDLPIERNECYFHQHPKGHYF
jgi:hypothetical protein